MIFTLLFVCLSSLFSSLQPEACRFLNNLGKKYAHTSSLPAFGNAIEWILFPSTTIQWRTAATKIKFKTIEKQTFEQMVKKAQNVNLLFSCVDVLDLFEQFCVPVTCCYAHVMLRHDLTKRLRKWVIGFADNFKAAEMNTQRVHGLHLVCTRLRWKLAFIS